MFKWCNFGNQISYSGYRKLSAWLCWLFNGLRYFWFTILCSTIQKPVFLKDQRCLNALEMASKAHLTQKISLSRPKTQRQDWKIIIFIHSLWVEDFKVAHNTYLSLCYTTDKLMNMNISLWSYDENRCEENIEDHTGRAYRSMEQDLNARLIFWKKPVHHPASPS